MMGTRGSSWLDKVAELYRREVRRRCPVRDVHELKLALASSGACRHVDRAIWWRGGRYEDVSAGDEWQVGESWYRRAEVCDAIEVVIKGEESIEPLGPRSNGPSEKVLVIYREDIVLGDLIAPQLLVPDEDDTGGLGALLPEGVQARARRLGEEAD